MTFVSSPVSSRWIPPRRPSGCAEFFPDEHVPPRAAAVLLELFG
jgi:hypothetical protein